MGFRRKQSYFKAKPRSGSRRVTVTCPSHFHVWCWRSVSARMCASRFHTSLAVSAGILGSGIAVTRWPVCTLAYAQRRARFCRGRGHNYVCVNCQLVALDRWSSGFRVSSPRLAREIGTGLPNKAVSFAHGIFSTLLFCRGTMYGVI